MNWFKRLFCRHAWIKDEPMRCDVTGSTGVSEGQVTLTLLTCSKCGKLDMIVSDRTYHRRNRKDSHA